MFTNFLLSSLIQYPSQFQKRDDTTKQIGNNVENKFQKASKACHNPKPPSPVQELVGKYNRLRDNKQVCAIFCCCEFGGNRKRGRGEKGKGSTFLAGHLLAVLGVELPNVDHDVALPVPHRHLPPIGKLAAPQKTHTLR